MSYGGFVSAHDVIASHRDWDRQDGEPVSDLCVDSAHEGCHSSISWATNHLEILRYFVNGVY